MASSCVVARFILFAVTVDTANGFAADYNQTKPQTKPLLKGRLSTESWAGPPFLPKLVALKETWIPYKVTHVAVDNRNPLVFLYVVISGGPNLGTYGSFNSCFPQALFPSRDFQEPAVLYCNSYSIMPA
jgi:hypothetical protein